MSTLPIAAAGLAYFALGGLWFTPLFGRQWDQAVGFDRPARWRPPPVYYVGPLVGCLVAAAATAFLIEATNARSLGECLRVGAVVGGGYGLSVTATNAIAPNMPKPGLYAAVVGAYHWLGMIVCSAVIHGLA
jgi:hypothetical protein